MPEPGRMFWKSLLTARRPEGEELLLRRGRRLGIDRSHGDPRLVAARAAAERGADGWPEVRGPLAAAQDADDLGFLVEGLAGVPGLERWIGGVAEADGADPLPRLLCAARRVERAGRGRWGTGVAAPDGLSGPAVAELEAAEAELREVARLRPSGAVLTTAHHLVQVCGQGLGVDAGTARERFEAVVGSAPGHLAAHRTYLRQLAGAPEGSAERVLAFARRAAGAEPAGGPLGELVALARLAEWAGLGRDPEGPSLRRPEAVAELRHAAERSVLHPDFVRRRDWALTANTFALACALAGDHVCARRLFRMLGDRVTEMPWLLLDERSPAVPFTAFRARVTV
ncbi:hypothetical protein [Actinacidiphila yeochonensis]|uniref:hypothetical protein n=1 Tax=Actinacidiphila yeochonensis TaxID=89050 RepID=UPI00068BD68D|nr:hypothetical protein [Actinacidiphila yeochonensis]